ncbi:MAG TPA: heme exporter protein CcmB [Polyangia bacterium]|jgi:heme exporter protein B|nr:heme exporter protein CcmB [Polyangia bacterium]
MPEAAANAGTPAASALAPPVAPSFLRQIARIAAKDLRIEWRSREILATMTFLAVVVVLIFSFAFVVGDARPPAPVTAGILWIAVVVSGTVGLGRTFDRERDGEAIRSLLLSPTPRAAIYLGKLAATVALMLVVEVVLTFLAGLLFSNKVAEQLGSVATLLVLGTIGFAAVGCVFSAALLRSRSRDVLLATLLYPIIVPIVIAGARGTAQLIDPLSPDLDGARFWTQFLLAVDVIFVTLGIWAFEPVVTGE